MLTNADFYQIKQLNPNTQCVNILKKFFHKSSFSLNFHEYMSHHHHLLDQYLTDNHYHSQSQKVIRGKINEYLILLYFYYKGIIHLYPQAYLFFIPDIKFDLVLFTKKKRIIAFNFKTCLRERYKQAIVEAQQLKKLDTRFEYYLLTNDATESQRLNNKITNGKVQGINQVINLFSPEANLFFKNLIQKNFIPFNNINLIKNKE